MNQDFIDAWTDARCNWLSWLGEPMLYDGGLCVNRTPEECIESQRHQHKAGLQIRKGESE